MKTQLRSGMSKHRIALVVILALSLTSFSISSAYGGFVLLSRESSVLYESSIGGADYTNTSSTNHFGLYKDGVSFEKSDDAGSGGSASAQQTTDAKLTDGSILSAGQLLAEAVAQLDDSDNNHVSFAAQSSHVVTFQVVDHSEPFHVMGDFGTLDPAANATIRVTSVAIPPWPLKRIDWHVNNSEVARFDSFGDLRPDIYQLSISVSSNAFNSPVNPHGFSQASRVNFAFEAGPAASAIPLPAAIWPGMILLGGAACAISRRVLR